ncbi:MAG: F0F1 ATP synthase subunit A [Clostridiales Family XIII bacterium]|jgi:F-type H+-transporting ATPase subunit a|nr:F0F1 ATP synthase subunit A [Clostridiales Family XIII bacterium]
MHDLNNLGPRIIIKFSDKIFITETVIWGWIAAIVIALLLILSARKLTQYPKGAQGVAELIVEFVYNLVGNTMGKHNIGYAPYIGTLFIFLVLGNMLGMFGFRPTTADVNMTFALSILTFLNIQIGSMRSRGVIGYFGHFAQPYPFLLPISILEEFSFPVSLGFRLFGNIFGGAIIMALVINGLGSLSHIVGMHYPFLEAIIPLPANLFFDIFEPIIQAYIFTMLTMVFIAKSIKAPGAAH